MQFWALIRKDTGHCLHNALNGQLCIFKSRHDARLCRMLICNKHLITVKKVVILTKKT